VMQEILELKDKMKTLEAELASANDELSGETVAWKKFVARSALMLSV